MSRITSESPTAAILKTLCDSFGRLSKELNNGALLPKSAAQELGEVRRVVKIARLHLQQRAGENVATHGDRSRSEH